MKSFEVKNKRTKWLLNLMITSLGVYLSFRFLLPLILPFLFAYFIAWIIRPVTEFLYRRLKLPRIIGGSLSVIILVSALGTGCYFLCRTLIKQMIMLVKNIPVYISAIAERLDNMCSSCDEIFGLVAGTARKTVDGHLLQTADKLRNEVIPGMTRQTLFIAVRLIAAIGVLLIIFVSAVLIAKDLPVLKKKFENNSFYMECHKVTDRLAGAGIAYLRCQLIIMLMVAVVCVIGLTLIRNDYALLIGTGIAVLDALPVLGSGIIFIPWSIIMLISGNIFQAAILITTYLVCQVIREVLEPKLIGNRIGIRPLYTLMAMFIGVKLFGIPGFFLGPIGLIIIIEVMKTLEEKERENNIVACDEE